MKFFLVFLLLAPVVSLAVNNQQSGFQGDREQQYQRDPFTASGKMHAQVGLSPNERAGVYGGFIPGYGAAAQGAPKMRLKGYVTKGVSKASALLEIEGGGVYMVSEGDEIGLHSIGVSGVLKVVEVGPNGVKVQAGRINQVILVK